MNMNPSRTTVADCRKHPRIKCRAIVDNVGPTLDVSAGGVRVLTAHPLPEGTEVRLAFQLPDADEPVHCHGRVVHAGRSLIDADLYEMGIQYQRMMARHRTAITQYVHRRADGAALD
jgi:c-di-GMP-binding flagellar brake protein YcgR